MKKHDQIKQLGDKNLIELVLRLQRQLSNKKILDQTTLDYSNDNLITDKILKAKYNFLYSEARKRNTKSSDYESVITQ